MAKWHLDEMRTAFERRGWRVAAELPGNDRDISATWELKRPADSHTLTIDFEGLDEAKTLPLDESYGCRLRNCRLELYFRRRGTNDPAARQRWRRELALFVEAASETKAV